MKKSIPALALLTLLLGASQSAPAQVGAFEPDSPFAKAEAAAVGERPVTFRGEFTVSEVLDRMRNAGLNFLTLQRSEFSRVKLRLNVTEKPMRDVMNALATAVGGSWNTEGTIWVLLTPPKIPVAQVEDGLLPMAVTNPNATVQVLPPSVSGAIKPKVTTKKKPVRKRTSHKKRRG